MVPSVICEPHVEFARQQTRTQPPPRGFAIAKQRSGFTKSTKFRAGGMFVSFCDPTGNSILTVTNSLRS
ncbi:hypothetical protein A2943_02705 [Candidatus Adlerbacteria bacterium RIFCSPLOWO2_01_FULL_51_16]|uniref:Uncharacterized protein n=1 Tax=Candidatus Adlerbacteria bacterium RIFCSPLOWO2_01_FULL_51_16 TaxID=1797243 RepID=A0A1F4XGC9_9BACT|nr:MAG: hypothetical protein A2943_02705 [Candidatus Adlerbacteria bacterium RIFCSPLOWO2_01_FULL_51_16]